MSSRLLKRYIKDDLLPKSKPSESESDEEVQPFKNSPKKHVKNRFELLNSDTHSQSDTEAKEDDDKDTQQTVTSKAQTITEAAQTIDYNSDSLKRKKKKKKKKLRSQKSIEDTVDHKEEEIDAAIKEVQEMYGEADQLASFTAQSISQTKKPRKSILSTDFRFLNYTNEVRKIFGHDVMQAELHKKRGRGRNHTRTSCLISPKNWNHLINNGLKMECVESKDNVHYFNFQHSKQYQIIQQNFLKIVEMGDPGQIEALMQTHPSNLDLMIQFSEICTVVESFQMAAELIEMVLYVSEMSFHPNFNLVQANCRLDYKRSTNRSFFVALFKHIILIGQKHYNRTALELCKALLGLDTDEDPLGVILMIDYFAIKSGELEFLLQIFNEWNKAKNLIFLPNFAYSIPLAMYLQAIQTGQEDDIALATDMLLNSFHRFPELIVPLLNACKAETVTDIMCHPFFNSNNKYEYPDALRMLTELYVARAFGLWKETAVLDWLVSTVKSALSGATSSELIPTDYKQKRVAAYIRTARPILRHISLSNMKDVTLTIPTDLTNNVIYSFDPFPPENSIDIYRRPTPTATRQTGYLSTFLRSLVPTYTVEQEDNRAQAEGANAELSAQEQLQRHLTSLLDVMRDLLNNIQVIDGDVESDAE